MALFADDLGAWVASRSLKLIQLRLQLIIDHIEKWMSMWRSKTSTSKTVYNIFNKGRQFTQLKIKLNFGPEMIEAEKNFKFLGITLDPRLTLNQKAKHFEETKREKLMNIT